MEKDVFIKLCNELETNYGFKGSKRMCALEILGMFLFTVGHGAGNRLTQEQFQHSGETVSRYFNKVLDVLCHMSVDVLKTPDPEFKDVPEEILNDSRYMPHFKNCIGVIEGVHVNVIIPPEGQVPFIGRKGIPTQNIMAIWKKRWKTLRDMPSYPYTKQVKIVIASMTLHNYIRRHAKHDRRFEKIRDDSKYCANDQKTNVEDEDETSRTSNSNGMDNIRDMIPTSLMRDT
ncbi:uncharacterized protein LOC133795613 [Humulus lupulus]|uniref:uncharacterized protein LOC133795613 n=1 Tax=Humulus lupulus TaxID=3486 RepID=UPI002B4180F0|nr:uncharacterized protein LOC133795613 [Humulus lupulus]